MDVLENLSTILNCGHMEIPFQYLGMSIGGTQGNHNFGKK